jgi:tetratricopeptide (TPR) repeat protein/O-antigen ligase
MLRQAGTWSCGEESTRLDRAIEGLLVALLGFMPLAFGVVEAWSEEIVLILVAAISVVFCLKTMISGRAAVSWSWSYVPIIVFVALVGAQLVSMPSNWVRFISHQTAEEKTQLLSALSGANLPASRMTLSFYTHATWHDLRLVLAVGVVYVVVLSTYRRPDQVVRLLAAVAIIGGAVAILALAQSAFGNDKIYWFVESPHGNANSGPFINHSHYAQFMNLSIGAGLALILIKLHQAFTGVQVTPPIVARYFSSPDARHFWALSAMVALGAATVFVSLSRGGMISMMIAGAFTTVVLSAKKSLRGPAWVMTILALAAFVCVLYVGFDAVYDRLGTLSDLHRAQGGRWQMLKDVAVAWTRFPLVGAGLGTHEVVYPMFDRSTVVALASHAENEYAQAAEETGIIGLVSLVAFGVFIGWHYVRTASGSQSSVQCAVYGLGFGLLAILVHSLSDFGQHLPANAILSTVFCALLVRLPQMDAEYVPSGTGPVSEQTRTFHYGVAVLAVVGLVWGLVLVQADAARRAETHWARALEAEGNLREKDWQGSDDEYAYLLECAASARDCQPGNNKYRHWLNVYRWQAVSRKTDPNTGEVLLPQAVLGIVGRIASELEEAVTLCPTFGPTWCVLGQLETFVLKRRDEGVRHVDIGRRLAPCDPTVCYVAGVLYAERGEVDAALEQWQRAVQLDRLLFVDVAASLAVELSRPDLAYNLARQDSRFLIRLEQILDGSDVDPELLQRIAGEIRGLLERECQEADAPAWKFARLAHTYHQQGRTEMAIEMYRHALGLTYYQVSWRFQLAELYAEQGLVSQALDELRVCLRQRPQFGAAQRLLDRLLAQAGTSQSP